MQYYYVVMVTYLVETTCQGPMEALALINKEHRGSALQGPMEYRTYLAEARGTFVFLLPGFHGST